MVCVVCPDEVDAEVLSTALMVAIPEQEKKILSNFEIDDFRRF